MMLDGFIQLLTADSTVNGLITGRIYKNVLPRGYVLPAMVIHRYGGTQEYQYDGPVGTREDQVQVDCYSADPEVTQQLSEATRAVLSDFKGQLPDNTVVQGCFLERDMDMPFLPHADTKGMSTRSMLGFRVVSVRK